MTEPNKNTIIKTLEVCLSIRYGSRSFADGNGDGIGDPL